MKLFASKTKIFSGQHRTGLWYKIKNKQTLHRNKENLAQTHCIAMLSLLLITYQETTTMAATEQCLNSSVCVIVLHTNTSVWMSVTYSESTWIQLMFIPTCPANIHYCCEKIHSWPSRDQHLGQRPWYTKVIHLSGRGNRSMLLTVLWSLEGRQPLSQLNILDQWSSRLSAAWLSSRASR